MDGLHTLDLLVAFVAGIAAGLLLTSMLDEIERREASKITSAS